MGTARRFALLALVIAVNTGCELLVGSDPPTSPTSLAFVRLTPTSAELTVGDSVFLIAEVVGVAAGQSPPVTWSSEDPAVVTVASTAQTATARCVASGLTRVTASAGFSTSLPGFADIRCTVAPPPPPPPPPLVGLIEVTPGALAFENVRGVTPCPQFIGNLAVTNLQRRELILTFRTNNAALVPSLSQVTLPANRDGGVAINFNCTVMNNFIGQAEITARTPDGLTETKQVPIAATIR